jgi:hypothetical protein
VLFLGREWAVAVPCTSVHKPIHSVCQMPLQGILKSLDEPVSSEVTNQIITYMRSMPAGKEELISQCVTHLDKAQTLGAMLAVVHALNDGEFLLRCHTDVNENELVSEFNKMFGDEELETKQTSPFDSVNALDTSEKTPAVEPL